MRKHPLLHLALLFALILCAFGSLSAQTKRIRPAAELVLVHAKLVIDPASGATIRDGAIQISNGRILRVAPFSEFERLPGYKIVDYSDKYIIPGLIDLHAHLYGGVQLRVTTNESGPIFLLASGVTTASAPGSMDPGGDLALRNRIDSGVLLGPRYFLAGEYLEMDPVTVRWMNPLATPEEARLKIDRWADQGVTAIKLYANMHGEIMQAAVAHAHERGLRVMAHVGATTFREAIEMGVDQLFHGVLALSDAAVAPWDPRDYKDNQRQIAQFDLKAPKIIDLLKLAAQRKVVLTPTAVVMEPPLFEKQHLAEQQRFFAPSTWTIIAKQADAPPDAAALAVMDKQREFIKAAYDAGCILGTGTDYVVWRLLHGYSLWREMDIFAEAGLPPMAILKAATYNGAYAIGRTDQVGSIETGKFADFVVLNANPLDTIANVRSVYRVVKSGVIYDPEELLKTREGRVF